MQDTIITIILVVATIWLLAVSVWLIIDLVRDIKEEKRIQQRHEELVNKWKDINLISKATKDDFIKNKEISDYIDNIIRESIDRVDNCPYKNNNHTYEKTNYIVPCHILIAQGSCNALKGIDEQ